MIVVFFSGGCNNNVYRTDAILNKYDSDLKKEILQANIIEPSDSLKTKIDVIEPVFVDNTQFAYTATVVAKEIQNYPIAGIVNHHSLAMDLQSRFFKSLKLSRSNIKTFIIISPDHFLMGGDVSTHAFPYITQAGTVISQALPLEGIYEARNVRTFAKEHGVGALAPFIAREFPEAQIIPLFIRPEVGSEMLKKTAFTIKQLMNEDVFIVISADMSHYLEDKQARKNDNITMNWIKNNEWEKLSSANDDYTDSGQSFKLLHYLFMEMNLEPKFNLLDYAISTDYGADKKETTSYINGYYIINK